MTYDSNLNTDFAAEVNVSTASAIIFSPDNPYLVLIGNSTKHTKPVLPGGRIETTDAKLDVNNPGLSCLNREIKEELGTELLNPKYIGKASDPNRDIRFVSYDKLINVVTDPPLQDMNLKLPDKVLVKARYGNPDFIYTGTVDTNSIKETEELFNHRFIDTKKLKIGSLSVGHDIILLHYRKMLIDNRNSLAKDSLHDFNANSF